MNQFHFKLEHVYIPRLKYALSWVPFASRYLPLGAAAAPESGSSVVHQNNFLEPLNKSEFQMSNQIPLDESHR
jgi:hypothetical protein